MELNTMNHIKPLLRMKRAGSYDQKNQMVQLAMKACLHESKVLKKAYIRQVGRIKVGVMVQQLPVVVEKVAQDLLLQKGVVVVVASTPRSGRASRARIP